MKSQAKKAITLSGGSAILVLVVGFGGGDLLPTSTTTTTTIADAGALVTASAVGGAELLGQAPANNPPCVVDPTNPCPPLVEDSANWPSRPQPEISSTPRTQIICQPAGPRWGAFCSRRIVP